MSSDIIALAESRVCGGCIENSQWAARAVWYLKPEDFNQWDCRLIFDAITKLVKDDKPIDLIQIGNLIPDNVKQKLLSLQTDMIDEKYFESSMKFIKESAMKRRFGMLADNLKKKSVNGDVSEDIYSSLISEANRIVNDVAQGEDGTLDSAIIKHDKFIDAILRGEIIPVKMPFKELSEVVLYPENQCIIGAHTSVGKTAFALHIAIESARKGRRVLFVSAEMTEVEMIQRVASDRCGIGIGMMRRNNVKLDNHPDLRKFQDEVRSSGGELKIRYIPGANENDIRRELDVMDTFGGTDVLFMDYIQAMECREKSNKSLKEQIGFLSRWFMREANKRKCINFIMSQLSRPGKEDRYNNREPTIWDLKECGNLENDPPVVILLHRADRTADYKDWNVKIKVVKNRNGSLCEYTYIFDSWSAQWK